MGMSMGKLKHKRKKKESKKKYSGISGKKVSGRDSAGPGRLKGTLQGNRKGFAFLQPEKKGEDDVFIPPHGVGGALHGDRVVIELASGGKGKRREGEVISVLETKTPRVVGTFYQEKGRCWVVPDESRNSRAINIPSGGKRKEVRSGDKVVVMLQREARGRELQGTIVERLGEAGSPGVDMLSLMMKHSLSTDFPARVKEEVKELPPEEEIANLAERESRKDLRHRLVITVDPEEAEDLDDAISLEVRPGGGYRLGVHIADVGYYVKERSALYREALQRGTSTYLVDRVVHMLPPELSQERCSLQEGKERLALSVEIDLDAKGERKSYRVFHSLLKVRHGLSYGQVERELQGEGAFPSSLQEMMEEMSVLAEKLKENRLEQGALDLDIPEPDIKLDHRGAPLSITRKKTGRAESIIEEFMLQANQAVAEYLHRRRLPLLYRVHPRPEKEKMIIFRNIMSLLGLKLPGSPEEANPRRLQKLIRQVRGDPREITVNYLLLRSLSQARYSVSREEHFGLALKCYTHFTSPIRRFPDLVNHKILSAHLKGELTGKKIERLRKDLPEIAENCSRMERKALEAERESQDLKKIEYMLGRQGEEFEGNISGGTSFGMFVEVDNTIEGMVSLAEMNDDYYIFQEELMTLTGRRSRRQYRLGDRVKVRVNRVSLEEQVIDFQLIGKVKHKH